MRTIAEDRRPDAATLIAAARQLERGATGLTSPEAVAGTLDEIEQALVALDHTCLLAASALIPPGAPDDEICERFRAAAARWPATGAAPPYERQAAILSSLHDTGAALRAAVRRCRHARQALAAAAR